MKKYEYKVVNYICTVYVEDTLNEYAEDGWRCVSVIACENEFCMVVLEREI